MAPPTETEKKALEHAILEQLAPTPYASSSLAGLTNGTTNFVFRAQLIKPLEDGTRSVIVKHTTYYAAVNKDFPIDASRSIFEGAMLQALNEFPQDGPPSTFEAKAPRLLWYSRTTNTQVLEDFADTVDLKASLLASVGSDHPLADTGHLVGQALGRWLQTFHAWASAPEQAGLRETVAANEPMRTLKKQITYDALTGIVAQYGVEGDQTKLDELKAVQAMANDEFAKQPVDHDAHAHWGIIHGDFWSGNILVPAHDTPSRIIVVDWEFAQYGHRAYDLGQLVGDLLERNHFRGAIASLDVLAGFAAGYGFSTLDDDDLAFRTCIHAGVQLVGCMIRRAPNGPWPGTPKQVEQAMQLGTDLIVNGSRRDRDWFETSAFSSLFRRCKA